MAESPIRKKSARMANSDASTGTLSMADIKELFALMRENEIAELQLEQQETRIHIVSKGAHAAPAAQMVPVMAGVPPLGVVGLSGHVQTGQAAITAPGKGEGADVSTAEPGVADSASAPSNVLTVYSPMVGTFYCAPAPDAPPFVRVGESVTEDTVLCIIEAMKLMNEIKAETKGRIFKMLVETGSPVEYNQPLFLIEP
ncbi:MAG: acetyl-CoA carboxylase biotin carboxyl carrier protein [Candidatus Sumerlaeaceae bacterium]